MHNLLAGSYGSLSKKASYLRLSAGAFAESMKSGSFRSLYRGQGIEFSGVREYLRGDDVRAIDWNVTARMGRPYVKMFEEERELQVFLIVDRSASMFTGLRGRMKYTAAAETAALLAIASENNSSPVGAVFFDGEIHFSCAPECGPERTMLLISQLDSMEHCTKGSVLGNALTGAAKMLKRRSLVFIISDFRTAGWEEPFAFLAHKNDVAAVRITDISDSELPEIGSVPFTDCETDAELVLPTFSDAFKSAWREDFRLRTKKWHDYCIRHGASPLSISTEEAPARALANFFASRGQGR